jgi:hypothetical protein
MSNPCNLPLYQKKCCVDCQFFVDNPIMFADTPMCTSYAREFCVIVPNNFNMQNYCVRFIFFENI